jgi:hypothetical protein
MTATRRGSVPSRGDPAIDDVIHVVVGQSHPWKELSSRPLDDGETGEGTWHSIDARS